MHGYLIRSKSVIDFVNSLTNYVIRDEIYEVLKGHPPIVQVNHQSQIPFTVLCNRKRIYKNR